MSDHVYIITPAGAVTGGPELCHQLADALNAAGRRASVVYHPFGRAHQTPRPYHGYDCRPAEGVDPGATVVLPEVYGHLVGDFPDCRVYFWWMSVNNFHSRAAQTVGAAAQLITLRQQVDLHLYQSEYARRFLETSRLGPARRLSDKLAAEYLKPTVRGPRADVVAFNPAKGMSRTEQILRALTCGLHHPPQMVALRNMSRTDVREVLSRTKVYIDFGSHPGKDRLPREAAALGACVITNRRGAAANGVDIPIPREFKIDDRKPGFERRAAAKVVQILADFDRHSAMFDGYRRTIADESEQFAADIAGAFTPAEVFL